MRDADFDRLYRREAQGLYGFLAYRTGDRALAEDLLADTFERALRARRGFDRRRGTERNWLYAIALNLLRDHARRAATEGRAVDRVRSGRAASAGLRGRGRRAPRRAGRARWPRSPRRSARRSPCASAPSSPCPRWPPCSGCR